MMTTLLRSQTSAPIRSSMGLMRLGPPESCIMARSTRQVTMSPGLTRASPAARAMIFSASVMVMVLSFPARGVLQITFAARRVPIRAAS